MAEEQRVVLTRGDPVYSIYVWRQDSIALARLRPLIEEIVVLADTTCETWGPGESNCLTNTRTKPDQMCWPCRLKAIRARLYGYKTKKKEE